jgi:hypothetical protein
MHTSATVDFAVVLAREVVLELDDGPTVMLRPGDTVVRNGVRHRWSNPGHVLAVLAGCMWGFTVSLSPAAADHISPPAGQFGRRVL